MSPARRVLVTGATGGLGLALVQAFVAAGFAVRATGRSVAMADRIAGMGAQFVAADLTHPQAARTLCNGQDSVVHAAALSASWGAAAAFEAINVTATQKLLDAARAAGCRRFVFISSPSIYAAMRDRTGLTESDPPAAPLNHYARTKLQAERLVLAAHGDAFGTCAVRPRALVGPDDTVLLPRLMQLVRGGWMPLPRGGRALVELTDVRDAAQAIVQAEQHIDRITGRAVNISGGVAVPVRWIAEELARALTLRVRFIPLPMSIAQALAYCSERLAKAREPRLTRYALATLGWSQTFDLTLAREALGYAPRHDALATLLAVARARAA